ncbi:MAG: DUF3305 domain-containing protein [Sedimenticola sp.]|nr:DUF3305 domain-containing protein [Sedimenticola sp.]
MFQEPHGDLDEAVPSQFLISVVMECTPSENPWLDVTWEAVGVTAKVLDGDSSNRQVTLVHERDGIKQYLNSGFHLQLFVDECESYYHNLCSPSPSCFVIATEDSEGIPIPKIVSLSFDEAHAYLEVEEQVYAVAMPPELYRWCELFVLNHYVPELKKKRRLTNWKQGESQGAHNE